MSIQKKHVQKHDTIKFSRKRKKEPMNEEGLMSHRKRRRKERERGETLSLRASEIKEYKIKSGLARLFSIDCFVCRTVSELFLAFW